MSTTSNALLKKLLDEAGVPASLPPDIERRARLIAAAYRYTIEPDGRGGYTGVAEELPTGSAHAATPEQCLTQITTGATLAVAALLILDRTPPPPLTPAARAAT